MSRKAGDIPAWLAALAALVVPLLAAIAAWGAANQRLSTHDDELLRVRVGIEHIQRSIADLGQRLANIEGWREAQD